MVKKTILTSIIILVTTIGGVSQDRDAKNDIHLNQLGFYPHAPKIAVVEKDVEEPFYIVSTDTDERVYSAPLSELRKSQYGTKVVRLADFSSFDKEGTYRLLLPSVGYSYTFTISPGVFKEVADASLKGYYFQRASTGLPEAYAGKWQREAGHPDDSVMVHASAATSERPEGTIISSARGWYDAGDYNKYIVNSGITMGTLLSFYEDFPSYAKDITLNIPEKDNAIPDLLDEVLWNLRWMLTMQDPNDGGVYHKMTSPDFAGSVRPEADQDERYVVQKSTAATLDFAAVMAQASRVFREFDQQLPGLADSCLQAAKEAWGWAQDHPDMIYSQRELNEEYDPDINTGAYGDQELQDELSWAAAEMYATTQEDHYYDSVDIKSANEMILPSWGQVQALGYYTLLRNQDNLTDAAKEDIPQLRQGLLQFADKLVEGQQNMAFGTVMGHTPDNFIWGSNSVAGNQGIALIQAYKLTSDSSYHDAALSNLDYLLGRNATGYSFVTGYGKKATMFPHHRPSEGDDNEEPVPGLLAGGPNPGQQDGCDYPSDLPDESYVDEECSYASNEIAINWNAPLVYLLHGLEAVQQEGDHSSPD